MAKPQIAIRWNSGSDEDYAASMEALASYKPPPALEASIAIKGIVRKAAVNAIIRTAEQYGADIALTLKATWNEEDDVRQLRLFPVPGAAEGPREITTGDITVDTETGEVKGNMRGTLDALQAPEADAE